LSSISEMKLSLTRFIVRTIAASGSERSCARGRALAGARPVDGRPPTAIPRRSRAAVNARAAAAAEPFAPVTCRSSTDSAESGADSRPR
jgi:hypothetical protein